MLLLGTPFCLHVGEQAVLSDACTTLTYPAFRNPLGRSSTVDSHPECVGCRRCIALSSHAVRSEPHPASCSHTAAAPTSDHSRRRGAMLGRACAYVPHMRARPCCVLNDFLLELGAAQARRQRLPRRRRSLGARGEAAGLAALSALGPVSAPQPAPCVRLVACAHLRSGHRMRGACGAGGSHIFPSNFRIINDTKSRVHSLRLHSLSTQTPQRSTHATTQSMSLRKVPRPSLVSSSPWLMRVATTAAEWRARRAARERSPYPSLAAAQEKAPSSARRRGIAPSRIARHADGHSATRRRGEAPRLAICS